MSSIENIIEKLINPQMKQKFLDNQISHLWIFGSLAKGNDNQYSDLDLLYQRDYNLPDNSGRFGFFGLIADIKQECQKKVDLVSIDYIDDLIKNEVLSTKIQIW